jgi:peptide/nickel transport system substrate-binding protein
MFNAFKLGNIDIINTYMSNYSDYVGTMGYNKKEFLGRNFTYISFNCNDGILSDKAVRKAVSMGINKENLVSILFAGTKSAANTGLDYGSYLNNSEGVVSYNLDQAKKQLQDSGWVYTGNRWQKTIDRYSRKLILSLVVNENDQERVNVANTISNQLNEIGIKINVAKVSPERYYQYLNEKNYQMILTGVDNSINPDLSYFCGQNNLSNYNNADVASEIMDINKIKDAQKQVNEDVPYLGLYRNKGYVILNANVGGNFNPNSYFTYYNFNEWFRQQ